MTKILPKNTRRWEEVKFIYTEDSGRNIVTSQRVSKDINGNPFIKLSYLVNERKINDKKTQFWGNPKNLRKVQITYEENRNQNGKGIVTRYCPFNPNSSTYTIKNFIKDIFTICEDKFNKFNITFCIDYWGENKFTNNIPQKIE